MMFEGIDPLAVDEKWHRVRWSGEEVAQALQLRAALCTDEEIGEYLGRSALSVKSKLWKELAAIRRLDAVMGRDVAQPFAPLHKAQIEALAPIADEHAAGSIPALCRELIDRLAARPDVVAMLMEGGR